MKLVKTKRFASKEFFIAGSKVRTTKTIDSNER